MSPQIGTKIFKLPIPALEKIRDLLYYDGPLLAEYESEGEKYLFYWCDTVEQFQRWMIIRIKKLPFLKYLTGEIPLRELIVNCPDRAVFLVDLDNDASYQSVFYAALEELPDSYVPANDSFYDPKYGEIRTENSCVIFMDGEWKLGEFGDFPKYLADVYTYLYAAGLHSDTAMPAHLFSMDWRGRGFTSSAFFRGLAYGIPEADKAKLDEMHLNSPGYVKVHMNPIVSPTITSAINQYHINEFEINKRYLLLHKWVNRANRSSTDEFSSLTIEKAARELVEKLGSISWAKLETASNKDLESIVQSVLAYKRRLEHLTKFQRKGLVTFVEVP